MLTQKELKKSLHYNPDTGIFIRILRYAHCVKTGIVAGGLHNGYVSIFVLGASYKAHRLAWLYVYGYMPENDMDHINKIKTDNRIENLREVSRQCNVRNTGNRSTNTSGVKGVCWCKTYRKWLAKITINRKTIYLCRHEDFTEAVCHRLASEQCVGWEGCDSSSPAYLYVKENL